MLNGGVWRRCGVTLLLVCCAGVGGLAQVDNRFAVGASGGIVGAPSERVDGHARLGPLIRIGTAEDGWGGRIGFNWYAADLEEPLSGVSRSFGRLRVRPVMYGYGYTRVFGRVSASASLLAGVAFTSFRPEPRFLAAYAEALGVPAVDDDVSHTVAIKPEISLWFDLNRSLGLNVNTGYMLARPSITLRSAAGDDRRDVDANALMLNVGLVYSVF